MTLQKTINNIQNSKTRFFNLNNVWVNLDIIKNSTTIIYSYNDEQYFFKIHNKTILRTPIFYPNLMLIGNSGFKIYIFKDIVDSEDLYLQGFIGSKEYLKNIIKQRNIF
jgi:hypothetical protein